MFSNYKRAILDHFLSMQKEGTLPIKLASLTPANIRNYLLQILSERYDKRKDDKALEAITGFMGTREEWYEYIKKMDVEKFKPVILFLKQKVKNPDDKQVYLAALLLDFDRPFDISKSYELGKKETDNVKHAEVELEDFALNSKAVGSAIGSNSHGKFYKGKKGINRKLAFTSVAGMVLLGGGLAIGKYMGENYNGHCMYWDEVEFVRASCDIKVPQDLELLAFDSAKVEGFKLITKLDTISPNSIGKVHYLKYQNKFEFFTTGGKHPIHNKRLKRLTKYIYYKEIRH
ncbi:MAG: hypothetical protein EOO99_00370 [Pedobacter sp.]|nr:MAG: hypothetical protein EOO99_00370 [Pedobacter sp.]